MPRPRQEAPRRTPSLRDIEAARYVGSAEHKVERWWGGLPEAYENAEGNARRPKRQTTTICRRIGEADRDEATGWVRHALARGQFKFVEGDKTFPRYLWFRDETGQHWMGRSVNSVAGTYKGWPISEAEKRGIFD